MSKRKRLTTDERLALVDHLELEAATMRSAAKQLREAALSDEALPGGAENSWPALFEAALAGETVAAQALGWRWLGSSWLTRARHQVKLRVELIEAEAGEAARGA